MIQDDDIPGCGPIFSLLPKYPLRRLLLRMLHPDPNKRITIHEALNDRWLKSSVECCVRDSSETENVVTSIDVADKDSARLAGKMIVQKMHNHLPPEKKRMP